MVIRVVASLVVVLLSRNSWKDVSKTTKKVKQLTIKKNKLKVMKSIFRAFALMAMVALVATSCKKNEEKTQFAVTIGEIQGFEAGPSLDGSKAYLDVNGYFHWNEGDQIMVYNLSSTGGSSSALYTSIPGSEGYSKTHFDGPSLGAANTPGYRLFYNPAKLSGGLDDENRQTFVVSNTQTYNSNYLCDPTAMVMACTSDASVENFAMQHIFGILDVAIANNTGTKSVDRIEVKDAAFNLSGNLSLKLHEVDADQFSTLFNMCESGNSGYEAALASYLNQIGYCANGDGEKTITLQCNNFALPYRQWQYFFIYLRPGALYKGFTVTIYYTDGTNVVKTIEPENAMNYIIKPGWCRNMYFTTGQGFLQ